MKITRSQVHTNIRMLSAAAMAPETHTLAEWRIVAHAVLGADFLNKLPLVWIIRIGILLEVKRRRQTKWKN